MSKNNLNPGLVYRNEAIMKRIFLVGLLCILFPIDAIFIGYFRKLIGRKVLLNDFGQNSREEFYIYTMLLIGLFLILYFLTNYKKPIIRVDDQLIVIKANNSSKTYSKKSKDLIFYEFVEKKMIIFHFKDEVISLDVDIVKRDELMKVLGEV